MNKADIGLIGLGVMGRNLLLNIHDHGFKAVVFNRTASRTEEFLTGPAAGTGIRGATTLEELVSALGTPRILLLMVKAGRAVDELVEQLIPLLDAGDIIIDGGNSHYRDTDRRASHLAAQGLRYLGLGVSGGEEGARHGPSLMPGGHPEAWPVVRPIFEAVAARVDGQPCCRWMGESGAGHFVKMVHNGIEYGDMQLIAEAYHLLRDGLGLGAVEVAETFDRWNEGRLSSYLIEITGRILAVRDDDGRPLVEKILDAAGQKGTGSWSVAAALELGVPLTLIGEAVFARILSANREERLEAARRLGDYPKTFGGDRRRAISALGDALYAARIISYAQGFMLLRTAAETYRWSLNFADIARVWRGGCIIRSILLEDIVRAFEKAPPPDSLLFDDFFVGALQQAETGWRRTVAMGIELGLPLPAFSAALAFYDGYRCEQLPANLVQAQRDYFGAHEFERRDRPRGTWFHSDWLRPGESKEN
jgi:6-phosphogluconate dehydrogenase